MSAAGAGKVAAQAAMSLGSFTAGPAHAMGWVFEYSPPGEFPEIVQATGAMLPGRNCYDVSPRDSDPMTACEESV